jgi:hypothetical protein
VSHFHHEQSGFGQMIGRLGDDRSHQIEAVASAGERERGLFTIFRREPGHRGIGDVRRVADDEVVAPPAKVLVQVRRDELHAFGERVIRDVAAGDRERIARKVRGVDVRAAIRQRREDCEAARAGTQIENALHARPLARPRREAVA